MTRETGVVRWFPRENSVVRWIDGLDPAARNLGFVAAIVGIGWLFYGRDGNLQTFLPFPQAAMSNDYHPKR